MSFSKSFVVIMAFLTMFSFGSTAYAEKAGPTATHAGQDLADAFVPEFTVPLAFLGSDKVEFTLLMEMLGVETHPGQDLAAAFLGAAKKCSNPPG